MISSLAKLFMLALSFLVINAHVFSQGAGVEIFIGRPMDYQIRTLAKAAKAIVESADRMQNTKAAFSARITKARNEYFNTLKSGRVSLEKGDSLFHLLLEKDMIHFLNEGFLAQSEEFQAFDDATGSIDNGIDPVARTAFDYWMEEMLDYLGSNAKNVMMLGTNLPLALEKTKNAYISYRYIRDWREYERKNIYPPGINMPKTYALSILHGYAYWSYRYHKEYAAPYKLPALKGDAEINKLYQQLATEYGEKQLLSVAEKYRKVPKDEEFISIDGKTYEATEPYKNMLQMLWETEGTAAIKVDYLVFYDMNPVKVEEKWKLLENCYGKDEVKAIANTITKGSRQLTENDRRLPGAPVNLGYTLTDAQQSGLAFGFMMRNVFENQLAKNNVEGYLLTLLSEQYDINTAAALNKAKDKMYTAYTKQKVLAAITPIRDHAISDKFMDPIRLQQWDKARKELLRLDSTTQNRYSRTGFVDANNKSGYNQLMRLLNPKLRILGNSPYDVVHSGQGEIYQDRSNSGKECEPEILMIIDVKKPANFHKSKGYYHTLISATQELVNVRCREVAVQKVNYHFYLDGELVRKSWAEKSDNFATLHTGMDTKEDGSIDQSGWTEKLRTGYWR